MQPVTRVYDGAGDLVHDCTEEGCAVSWDGYDLATGVAVKGRSDPGKAWDVSEPGVARLKPPPG